MNQTPRKPAHANKTQHLGNGYEIARVLTGYAYAKNGNTHNATPKYRWDLFLDGTRGDSSPNRHVLVVCAHDDEYRR